MVSKKERGTRSERDFSDVENYLDDDPPRLQQVMMMTPRLGSRERASLEKWTS